MKKIPGNVTVRETEDGKQIIEISLTREDIVAIMESFAVHLLGEGNMEPEEVKSILYKMSGEQDNLQNLIDQAVAVAEEITERPVSENLS